MSAGRSAMILLPNSENHNLRTRSVFNIKYEPTQPVFVALDLLFRCLANGHISVESFMSSESELHNKCKTMLGH